MYSVELEYIVNDDGENRIQFYIYRLGQSDWIDAMSATDLEEGFDWAKEWIENDNLNTV